MDDFISRAAAIQMVKEKPDMTPDEKAGVVARLQDIPAADVRPAVRGKWVDGKGNPVPWDELNKNCPYYSANCSVCGEWLTVSDEYPAIGNFCPNCGVDMREEPPNE